MILTKGGWLTDNVISAYIRLLNRTFQSDFQVFDDYTVTLLENRRKIAVRDFNLGACILHDKDRMHWSTICLDAKRTQLVACDSKIDIFKESSFTRVTTAFPATKGKLC